MPNSVASEVIKTVGEIIRSVFPQSQDIAIDQSNPAVEQATTDAALRGSVLGLASGVKAVTEEDATGKSEVDKRLCRCAHNISIYRGWSPRRSYPPKNAFGGTKSLHLKRGWMGLEERLSPLSNQSVRQIWRGGSHVKESLTVEACNRRH